MPSAVLLTDARVQAIKPPERGQEEYPDMKVTGLRLRVGAGGKKSWIVRARAGAKVINKTLGSYPAMGLAPARTAAIRVLETIQRDGSTESIDRTFGEVATSWIEKVAKGKNDSWKLQERQLDRHVLPHWRNKRLVDIRRATVRDLIDGIEGEVLPNRVLALIKTILRWAVSRDLLEVSPADGVGKPKDESARDRVLSMGEIKQVWDAAAFLGYPLTPFVRLLILTAQRRTEVASARWADIDLEAGTWALRAEDTKADRAHLVPLSAAAVDVLKDLPRFGSYVLTTDGETHIGGYGKAKARLDAFIGAQGDPLEPWTFHDLRRSAATHMVRLGISIETVGRVLNHARSGVTAKHYALHEFAPEKRGALDVWAQEIVNYG